MKSRTPLIIATLAVLAVAGAVFVLSGGESGGDAGSEALHRGATGADGLPTFKADAPAARAEPRALVDAATPQPVDAAPGGSSDGASSAAATRPTGPTRTVSGRILRASDNTPIGAVMVEGHGDADGPPSDSALSAEDGSFRLRLLPLDATRLTLKSAGSQAHQEFPLPPGKDDLTDQELVFDSGFRIAGLVSDSKGTPLAGAQVDAEAAKAVTGPDGRFVLRDVAPGDAPNVKVAARATAHTRETADVLVPHSPTEMPTVELKLNGAGRIAGQVTVSNGAPAAGTDVEVILQMVADDQSHTVSELSATCGDDGRFDIEHVPAGNYLLQAGEHAGLVDQGADSIARVMRLRKDAIAQASGTQSVPLFTWIPDVAVVEDQTTRLDIVLPAGSTLGGRVVDDGGSPVTDASVELRRCIRWPAPGMNGSSISISDDTYIETKGSGDGKGQASMTRAEGKLQTDASGRYEFTGLGPGERALTVTVPGGHLAPAARDVVLHADERMDTVDFVLSAGLTLRARVTDPAGRPLAGVAVYIAELDTNSISDKDFAGNSDVDGWIETHGLTPGKKRITMSLKGYSYLWDEVDPAASARVFVLKPSPRLRGVVVDASTGDPVAAYALKVQFGGSWMQSDTQPHPDGAFEEDVADDAHCTVTIDAPGYEPLTVEDVVPSQTAVTPAQFRIVRKT
jgi:protocatechuate 3,4-dioxygenase beta subunit